TDQQRTKPPGPDSSKPFPLLAIQRPRPAFIDTYLEYNRAWHRFLQQAEHLRLKLVNCLSLSDNLDDSPLIAQPFFQQLGIGCHTFHRRQRHGVPHKEDTPFFVPWRLRGIKMSGA